MDFGRVGTPDESGGSAVGIGSLGSLGDCGEGRRRKLDLGWTGILEESGSSSSVCCNFEIGSLGSLGGLC